MPTFKLTIVANNEAGSWASWDDKIAAIRDFYAPKCQLEITLVRSALKPVFSPFEPGVYVVDPAWYDAYVLPLAGDARIVMFAVPPSDHAVTCIAGIETGQTNGVWKTTIFTDETSSNYVGGVTQGNNAVVIACHELSHVFYAMLGETDNTHECFYGGKPQNVLADFDFAPWSAALASLYQQLLAAKAALQAIISSRDMPTKATIQNLAGAFRDYEGAPGDLNYQLNNPGDCRPSPDGYLAKYEPVEIVDTDTDPRYPFHKGKFAKFPTYDVGWLYLCNLLRNLIEAHPSWTLSQLVAHWAPSSDGNEPAAYAAFVGRRLGVDPATYQVKNIEI